LVSHLLTYLANPIVSPCKILDTVEV
jgi:hypothetical protein